MNVTVYSKPGCQQCKFTCRSLDQAGISYDVVDLTPNAAALEYVQDFGYSQAPVVVSDQPHWSGFNPTEIERLRLAIQQSPYPAGDPVPHENFMRHSFAPPPSHYFPLLVASVRSHR